MKTIGMITAIVIGMATTALATTPAQRCEQGKNLEAGKYTSCRQKVEAKFAVTGDVAAQTVGLEACLKKYSLDWSRLEAKAVTAGGTCPSMGDASAIQAVVDEHTTNIATALAGGPLSTCTPDLATCQSDLGTCQTGQATCAGDLGTCQTDLTACQGAASSTTTGTSPSVAADPATAGAAPAAATMPSLKCEQGKNIEAGKYAQCRQTAEAKFALTGDATARTAALKKCGASYATKWAKLELAATKAGGACPSMGDQSAIQAAIDAYTTNIANALAGGPLVDCAADLATCQGALGTCQNDLGTCTADLTTCQTDLADCQADTFVDTALSGNVTVDPACSGNVTFDVNVQAPTSQYGQPAGSFYFQCVGAACPAGTSFVPFAPASGSPGSSASFSLSLGAVAGPATLQVRISFVPELVGNGCHVLFAKPSRFLPSRMAYDVEIPAGSGCPTVSPTATTARSETYVQAFAPDIDLACAADVDFRAQAHTVPDGVPPPTGTFAYACSGFSCPIQLAIPSLSEFFGVAAATVTVPIEFFEVSTLSIEVTFIPDDPTQLPTSTLYQDQVADSTDCPTDLLTLDNGTSQTCTPG